MYRHTTRGMRQFVSVVGRADVFVLLPLAQQQFVRRGAGAAEGDVLDTVATKMAKVLPFLAPCGEQAHFGEVAQRDGLDDAVAGVAVLVGVIHDKAAVFAQGVADLGEGVGFGCAVLRMENWALAAVWASHGGSTLRILVSACSAAWARVGSVCPAAQRMPMMMASSSLWLNMSGGSWLWSLYSW